MSLASEILGLGIAAPAAIAAAVMWAARRFLPSGLSERYAPALALGAAFWLACALLPWSDLAPKRHWQWLPHLAGLAVFCAANHRALITRWRRFLVLALCSALLLVPKWPDLWPPRPFSMALLTVYLCGLMLLLDSLPERLMGPLLAGMLSLDSLVLTVLLAEMVRSAKFAQLGLMIAAGSAGVCLAALLLRPRPVLRGMIPVFAVLAGGLAYVGCIERQPAFPALLLVPFIPLALWLWPNRANKPPMTGAPEYSG